MPVLCRRTLAPGSHYGCSSSTTVMLPGTSPDSRRASLLSGADINTVQGCGMIAVSLLHRHLWANHRLPLLQLKLSLISNRTHVGVIHLTTRVRISIITCRASYVEMFEIYCVLWLITYWNKSSLQEPSVPRLCLVIWINTLPLNKVLVHILDTTSPVASGGRCQLFVVDSCTFHPCFQTAWC